MASDTGNAVAFFAWAVGVFAFVPQAWKVHKTGTTKDLSLLTFALIWIMMLFWSFMYIARDELMHINFVEFFLVTFITFRIWSNTHNTCGRGVYSSEQEVFYGS